MKTPRRDLAFGQLPACLAAFGARAVVALFAVTRRLLPAPAETR